MKHEIAISDAGSMLKTSLKYQMERKSYTEKAKPKLIEIRPIT